MIIFCSVHLSNTRFKTNIVFYVEGGDVLTSKMPTNDVESPQHFCHMTKRVIS